MKKRMYICMTGSLYCAAEINTTNQLCSKKKKQKTDNIAKKKNAVV